MRYLTKILSVLTAVTFFSNLSFGMERLFYMLRITPHERSTPTLNIAERNYKVIDVIVIQSYQVNEKGEVTGAVDQRVMNFTKDKNIKLMPLVTNVDFDGAKVAKFLHDTAAQTKAIQALVSECQKHQYQGFQMDFENIAVSNRNNLTIFYQKLAAAMHQAGYQISFAIAPQLTANDATGSAFLAQRYRELSGAYDYKALGQIADFVTLMAYDEHWGDTTPGPVAAYPWVENIIRYAVQYIPPEKISLGIPVYSDFWFTGKPARENFVKPILSQLSYDEIETVMDKYNLQLAWDETTKVPYVLFNYETLNEYIFAENAASFAAKLQLIQKYNLRGFSVWRIGMEDRRIWNVLKNM